MLRLRRRRQQYVPAGVSHGDASTTVSALLAFLADLTPLWFHLLELQRSDGYRAADSPAGQDHHLCQSPQEQHHRPGVPGTSTCPLPSHTSSVVSVSFSNRCCVYVWVYHTK